MLIVLLIKNSGLIRKPDNTSNQDQDPKENMIFGIDRKRQATNLNDAANRRQISRFYVIAQTRGSSAVEKYHFRLGSIFIPIISYEWNNNNKKIIDNNNKKTTAKKFQK